MLLQVVLNVASPQVRWEMRALLLSSARRQKPTALTAGPLASGLGLARMGFLLQGSFQLMFESPKSAEVLGMMEIPLQSKLLF